MILDAGCWMLAGDGVGNGEHSWMLFPINAKEREL